MQSLNRGDAAPTFEAPDQDNQTVALADYAGRQLFLFFYPKANTGG
jgi:peroxiredoxin Q/BCP